MKRQDNETKTPGSGRNWLCTLNNPDTALAEEYLRKWKESHKCTFVTGQVEKGEQGTVHLQYFLNFSAQVRLAHLKKVCSRSHF